MATVTPRSRRSELIEVAGRLFAESGFEGTTMRGIAAGCGITEAAIYRHFDGKEDLYGAVIQQKAAENGIRDYLAGRRDLGSIEDVLYAVARHILGTAKRDPILLRMLLYSSLEGYSGSRELYREFRQPYIEFLRDEVAARVAAGELREVEPTITGRCFVGMVMDCALNVELWNDLEKTKHRPEQVMDNNVAIYAKGLVRE